MVVALLYPTFLSLSLSLPLCCLFDWLKKGSIIKKRQKNQKERKRESRHKRQTEFRHSFTLLVLYNTA